MVYVKFLHIIKQHGKCSAKPATIAIPWIHLPAASKLGASPLKQSRRNGKFHLMELRNRCRCFAYAFPMLQELYSD